jgi:hypothetical protein
VYLGYVISGGELKINPTKMEAIMKCPVPTTLIESYESKIHISYYEEIMVKT